MLFCERDVLLSQCGEGLVLALELGLQRGALAVLGVGRGLAALVVGGEGGGAVLEEVLLPVVEEVDGEAVFLAQVGNSDLLDEVIPKDGDLLLGGEGPTLAGHGCSSARVLPLTLTKATSDFDWGNTEPVSDILCRCKPSDSISGLYLWAWPAGREFSRCFPASANQPGNLVGIDWPRPGRAVITG